MNPNVWIVSSETNMNSERNYKNSIVWFPSKQVYVNYDPPSKKLDNRTGSNPGTTLGLLLLIDCLFLFLFSFLNPQITSPLSLLPSNVVPVIYTYFKCNFIAELVPFEVQDSPFVLCRFDRRKIIGTKQIVMSDRRSFLIKIHSEG